MKDLELGKRMWSLSAKSERSTFAVEMWEEVAASYARVTRRSAVSEALQYLRDFVSHCHFAGHPATVGKELQTMGVSSVRWVIVPNFLLKQEVIGLSHPQIHGTRSRTFVLLDTEP